MTVTFDATGRFTNGSSSQQFGDVLRLSSASGEVLHATVTTSGVIPIVAGVRGIPSESTTAPPSLVLLRTIAANPTSTGALTVDPWGATPAGSPALATRASASVAGLVLAPPGPTNRARVAMRAGSAVVTAEAYAWFAGGIVVAAGTHILTGAAVTAVKTVLPDRVTFAGQPDALADLAVGDVVVAGVSAKTPVGLLRKVSAIDRTGTDLVVTTTDASLTDAVTQGALSAGTTNASSFRGAPHGERRASTNTVATPHAGETSCSIGGSLFFGGATVGCSHDFGPGADEWQVSLNSGATAAMGIDISIGWGVPPKIDATTRLDVSTSTTASVTAHLHADLDESYPMGKKQWAPIDIQLGPVPVVIVPEAEASLHVTGTVEETLSGIATFGASLGVICEAGGSCATTNDSGGSAGGSYQHTFHANVKAAFEPKISALLYDVAGLTATLSPYVSADADACTLTFKSGVDLVVGIALAPLGETIAEANATIPLVETTLAKMALRNCAIWSGSFNFSAHMNYVSGTYTRDVNTSSSMSIDPVGDVPPQYDIYPMSGSGSGADIQHDIWDCGHPPSPHQTDDIVNWAGDITVGGTQLDVYIADAGGGQWVAS